MGRGMAVVLVLGLSLGMAYEGRAYKESPAPPVRSGASGASDEVRALQLRLAEREALLAALRRKLESLDKDEAHLARARKLGVLEAVRQSRLPERQQRRLALVLMREAERHKLDPLLLVALIRTESGFDAYAKSSVGALGLMQVMPDTGKYLATQAGFELGRTSNLYDIETNVELGTAYLAELLRRFGSLESALVAYNAGPSGARRILAQPEVRRRFVAGYPRKVAEEFRRLKEGQELTRADQKPKRANPG
jgi:soluble lytic murein transglycosylase